jgi:hypothetical protein
LAGWVVGEDGFGKTGLEDTNSSPW